MKVRNIIAVALVLLSFVLLVPGLILPLLTIKISFNLMGSTVELYNQTRSILQSIRELHESGDDLVAGLILLFSVIVPFGKGLLLLLVGLVRSNITRWKLYAFVRSVSKWAMADVFAVGVYVAFLGSKAADNFDAQLQIGFYYFVAYCLVSLLALQFMTVPSPVPSAMEREENVPSGARGA